MKNKLLVLSALGAILLLGTFNWTGCSAQKSTQEPAQQEAAAPPAQAPEDKQVPPFIAAIQEKVKGKENQPAEEVFENIDILKGIPAGRVLPLMQIAFSKSLGVRCGHCHAMDNMAADLKPTKEIARDMWRMTGRINQELLKNIDNLQSEQPRINCTTCHRGQVKPALNLE
jgi:hypothetical protein